MNMVLMLMEDLLLLQRITIKESSWVGVLFSIKCIPCLKKIGKKWRLLSLFMLPMLSVEILLLKEIYIL